MNIVSLDLELNNLNDQPKIIEIGLSIGNLETREILDTKSILVDPREEITDYITNLTGITNDMVKNAPDIWDAYREMVRYLNLFSTMKQPIVWGAGDIRALKNEVDTLLNPTIDWPFGYTEMNVKCIVQAIKAANGDSTQGGLKQSLRYFNVKAEGPYHRANVDAENTLKLYFHLLNMLEGIK